jgi:hypothetical protein
MSDLSGYETHDAKSARVEIFRYIDQEGWWLEVIDQTGNLTRWDAPFKTDRDAYLEFCATVVVEGMKTFILQHHPIGSRRDFGRVDR